jgi:copper chaperone CopZ
MKTDNRLIGAGLLTAIASSLCCITPVLAVLAGSSGLAAGFSWLEPFRTYFVAMTVLILAFAWYQKLTPQPKKDCSCETTQKTGFIQTKSFLGIITFIAVLLLLFPSYAHIFFPKTESMTTIAPTADIQKVEFTIAGMTCTGCEHHIKAETGKLKGVLEVMVSYEKGNAIVKFDGKQTTVKEIEKAIDSIGYKSVKNEIIL